MNLLDLAASPQTTQNTCAMRRGRHSRVRDYRFELTGFSQNAVTAVPHFVPHFEADRGGCGRKLAHIRIAV